jgi:DNA-binding NtrC family response regulator
MLGLGAFRELANSVTRAVILSDDDKVQER